MPGNTALKSFFQMCWVGLTAFASTMTLLAVLGGPFQQQWLIDLGSHFHLQYIGILGLSLLVLLIRYRGQWMRVSIFGLSAFLSLMILLNMSFIAPYYFPLTHAQSMELSGKLKILHINLLWINRNDRQVIREIQEKDPDILSLAEYAGWWEETLERSGVLKKYPYHRVSSEKSARIALYSKRPIVSSTIQYTGEKNGTERDASIIAKIPLGKEVVTILAAHPRPPATPEYLQRQRAQMDSWIQQRQQLGEHLVIVGDLNSTPWSYQFKNLIQKADLQDTQYGFGLQPSWPSILPVLYIPIDHVLTSKSLITLQRETGPFIGSDHLPLYVEIGLPEPTPVSVTTWQGKSQLPVQLEG